MARWGAHRSVQAQRARQATVAPAAGLVHAVVIAAVAVVLGVLVGVAPAGAHAKVAASAPAAGETVDRPPGEVSLTLVAKPATVEGDPLMVFAPDGRRVDTGDTQVNADQTVLTVALDTSQGLPAGDYQFVYRVISADTHVIFGRLTFTARAALPPTGGAADAGTTGPAWTPRAEQAAAGSPVAASSGSGDAEAQRLADGRTDDVRLVAVAGGSAALALVALAWGLRPGARRRRAESTHVPTRRPARRPPTRRSSTLPGRAAPRPSAMPRPPATAGAAAVPGRAAPRPPAPRRPGGSPVPTRPLTAPALAVRGRADAAPVAPAAADRRAWPHADRGRPRSPTAR